MSEEVNGFHAGGLVSGLGSGTEEMLNRMGEDGRPVVTAGSVELATSRVAIKPLSSGVYVSGMDRHLMVSGLVPWGDAPEDDPEDDGGSVW